MKKFMSGLAIAAIASSVFLGAASAQRDASAGNGGVVTSTSDGGPVTVGNTDSGNASGSTTVVNAAELVGTEDLAAAIIALVLAGG
jgi:ABC-type phosphate transport system substrate-binding protein